MNFPEFVCFFAIYFAGSKISCIFALQNLKQFTIRIIPL